MPLFAYADETVFKAKNDDTLEILGCGIFITDKEISQEVIEIALKKLESINTTDESRCKRNRKTLSRRYFHAKDDSNDGRECICSSITEEINGVFCATYFDNVNPHEFRKASYKENFFERCLTSSSIEFFNSIEKITLIIEQRESLSKVHVDKWKQLLYHLFDDSSLKLPSFKTFYPNIEISFGSKSVPGLQVVDLLLWSCNRSKRIPIDDYWMKRLKYHFYHHSRIEGEKENGGQYYLNKYTPIVDISYPVRFTRSETTEELVAAYILIEGVLRKLEKSDFGDSNIHLYDDLKIVHEKLIKHDFILGSQDLVEVGTIFIRLYDSLPIYRDIPDDNEIVWVKLHHAKHIATLLLNLRYIEATRTRHYILRWREEMQSRNELDIIMNIVVS